MTLIIDKVYSTPFSVPTMFRAWTSPDMPVLPVTKIEVDVRKGGLLKLYTESDQYSSTMCGKFIEVDINKYLKYSWQWNDSQEITEVTVSFQPTADGCQIHLQHLGFLTEESRDRHASGWDHYLHELLIKIKEG